jgi:hypothetical protein
MTDKKQITYNYGGSILFPLGIIFIVLKLAEVINWSWWLVTLPLWIGPAIFFVIMTIFCVVAFSILSVAFCAMVITYVIEELKTK